jgi:transcriptional regulator with XRE-family HTH domain
MTAMSFDRPRRLGAFLRSCRNSIRIDRPDAAGHTRRVPGLRREEVSTRAGISVDYYTRLEQGREPNPSPQVVEALAGALNLNAAQRRYAYTVAGLAVPPLLVRVEEPLAPEFLALVEDQLIPAFVLGPQLDIVAMSGASRQLFDRFESGNFLEMLFLDPAALTFFLDWDSCARWAVVLLRVLSADSIPTEHGRALLQRLTAGSQAFADLWAVHSVDTASTHRVGIQHEEFGELFLHVFAFEVTDYPGHRLVLCRPASALTGSASINSDGTPVPGSGRAHPVPTTRLELTTH